MSDLTMFPCALCGSVTHERTNWGGLTGDDWYCINDDACQARCMKKEQERAANEAAQENETNDIENDSSDIRA